MECYITCRFYFDEEKIFEVHTLAIPERGDKIILKEKSFIVDEKVWKFAPTYTLGYLPIIDIYLRLI